MSDIGSDAEAFLESRNRQAQSYWHSVIEEYGVDAVVNLFEQADQAIERGNKGITMPLEGDTDRFALSIEVDRVAIRPIDGEQLSLPTAEARAILDVAQRAETLKENGAI